MFRYVLFPFSISNFCRELRNNYLCWKRDSVHEYYVFCISNIYCFIVEDGFLISYKERLLVNTRQNLTSTFREHQLLHQSTISTEQDHWWPRYIIWSRRGWRQCLVHNSIQWQLYLKLVPSQLIEICVLVW